MTRSEQILIDAGQRIRDFVLSTADDAAFSRFLRDLRDYGLTYSHISHVSGIKQMCVAGKDNPFQGDQFAGVLLTHAAHGLPDDYDWKAWWIENCPPAYRARVLSEAVDSMNLLDAIFLETHGRLPADEGRAYYERQRLEGRSWGAICAEIERHASQMGH